MIPAILILILVASIGINIQLRELIRLAKKQDFTTEDAQVRAAAEQVANAIKKLPKKEK
jgi:hypothetical protein